MTSDPSLPGTVLVLVLNASWEAPGPSETGSDWSPYVKPQTTAAFLVHISG